MGEDAYEPLAPPPAVPIAENAQPEATEDNNQYDAIMLPPVSAPVFLVILLLPVNAISLALGASGQARSKAFATVTSRRGVCNGSELSLQEIQEEHRKLLRLLVPYLPWSLEGRRQGEACAEDSREWRENQAWSAHTSQESCFQK